MKEIMQPIWKDLDMNKCKQTTLLCDDDDGKQCNLRVCAAQFFLSAKAKHITLCSTHSGTMPQQYKYEKEAINGDDIAREYFNVAN